MTLNKVRQYQQNQGGCTEKLRERQREYDLYYSSRAISTLSLQTSYKVGYTLTDKGKFHHMNMMLCPNQIGSPFSEGRDDSYKLLVVD